MISSKPKPGCLLFGSHGLLGSAIRAVLQSEREIVAPSWLEIGVKSPIERETVLKKALSGLQDCSIIDVIFACGVTNPAIPRDELLWSNFEFPKAITSTIVKLCGDKQKLRFVTLGTIQEEFSEACETNSYLGSKLELSRWIKEEALKHEKNHFFHLRLHTVYGEMFKSHMFLGQIFKALKEKQPFSMSSGNQLREYHYVGDIASSLRLLVEEETYSGRPIIEISSGAPIKLAKLAQEIFKAFNRQDLLKIGMLPSPPGENLSQKFQSSPFFCGKDRNVIEHIISIIRKQLSSI